MADRKSIKEFVQRWTGKGYEKGESQVFWLDLLHSVLGVENPLEMLVFEQKVKLDNTSFIDIMIPSTHVMIEQKSIKHDLSKPIKQSDGIPLTPFQQAKRYAAELPYSQRPRWIITCNFRTFYRYDMENPNSEPLIIELANLPRDAYLLDFLVKKESDKVVIEREISLQAGALVGELYRALLAEYRNPDREESLQSLNMLCVRLVFCMFAEDAQILGKARKMFAEYLQTFNGPHNKRMGLLELFKVLDTKQEDRDPYLSPLLAAFPYVNGGLFAKQDIEVPLFTDEIIDIIINRASAGFDWSSISPTIFGAVFESTLNPETRRSGGMHYTSIENIHKAIDPLFLDDLREELEGIIAIAQPKKRVARLREFRAKLGSLTFLDPACGSGNFLTCSYICLRRLENKALKAELGVEMVLDFEGLIHVSIGQFYGIEVNDFAVSVAQTALWIAESQMLRETAEIVQRELDFLPLKSYANIVEGNALRIDWQEVVPKKKVNYIMGNPPFVGARMMAQGSPQKREIEELFGKIKDVQDLDYVCGWYKKASEYIQGTDIAVSFVSTNSICQGSQVPILWQVLLYDYHVHINFAYRTFRWDSESTGKAAVHCVIVGFSAVEKAKKWLYHGKGAAMLVQNINPYLLDVADILVTARKTPLADAPKMCFGNQPRDGGHFIVDEKRREEILAKEPALVKWLRPYIGAEEFLHNKKRWCFWLSHATPADIKESKILYATVSAVKEFRTVSKAKTTRGYAKVPHLFAQMTQPEGQNYLLIPRVSSEQRRYVPIGFMSPDTVSSDAVQIIPNATLYHFGVLTSNVHMSWMRTIAGRLKSDYRYSKEIVYNSFPWCEPSEKACRAIERTAQGILDARALYPDSSLAALYDEVTMPKELRAAHRANDIAVMRAYGFWPKLNTESECVAALMKMYQTMTKG